MITIKPKKKVNPAPVAKPKPANPKPLEPEQEGPLLMGKTPTGTVTKEYPDGTTAEKKYDLTGEVGDTLIKEPHATVGVSMGVTRTTAPYESIKCTVSLFIPCAVDPEDINATYLSGREWVSDRITEFNDEVNEMLGTQQ